MPRIDLDILNQKQTPAFYASSLATRPAAGFVGRIFIDSDSPSTGLYRDTGTAWIQIADPGAGTTGTLQQVTTNGSSTNVGISVTTNGIGIGTAIPGANILDVHGTTGVLAQLENTTTQNSLLSFRNQGAGAWSVGNEYNAGANDFIIYDAVNFLNRFTLTNNGNATLQADLNMGTHNLTLNLINGMSVQNQTAGFNIAGGSTLTYTQSIRGTGTLSGTNTGNETTTSINSLYGYTPANGANYLPLAGGNLTGVVNSTTRLNLGGATDNSTYTLNVSGNQNIIGYSRSFISNASSLGGSYTALNDFGNNGGYTIFNLQNAGTICWIKGIINGPNSNSGADMVFGTPSTDTNGTARMTIKSTGIINMANVPSSSAGLVSGDIYKSAGVLMIV